MVTTYKSLRIYDIISQQIYKKNGSILSQKSIYTHLIYHSSRLCRPIPVRACVVTVLSKELTGTAAMAFVCFLLCTVLGKACWWVHVKFPGRKRRILLVLCWLPPSSHSLWDPGLWRSAPPRNEDGEHFPPEGSIVTQN